MPETTQLLGKESGLEPQISRYHESFLHELSCVWEQSVTLILHSNIVHQHMLGACVCVYVSCLFFNIINNINCAEQNQTRKTRG